MKLSPDSIPHQLEIFRNTSNSDSGSQNVSGWILDQHRHFSSFNANMRELITIQACVFTECEALLVDGSFALYQLPDFHLPLILHPTSPSIFLGASSDPSLLRSWSIIRVILERWREFVETRWNTGLLLVKKVTLSFNSSIFQWKIGCLQRGDDRFSSKITFSTKPCSKGEGSWWTWKKTPSNRIGVCFSRSCREDEEGGDAWFQLRILNCFNASWW